MSRLINYALLLFNAGKEFLIEVYNGIILALTIIVAIAVFIGAYMAAKVVQDHTAIKNNMAVQVVNEELTRRSISMLTQEQERLTALVDELVKDKLDAEWEKTKKEMEAAIKNMKYQPKNVLTYDTLRCSVYRLRGGLYVIEQCNVSLLMLSEGSEVFVNSRKCILEDKLYYQDSPGQPRSSFSCRGHK